MKSCGAVVREKKTEKMGEGKKKDKMMRRCGEKRLTLGQ
jgi:hypothetical protein